MTKSSLTEAIAVASSTPRDAALTPKKAQRPRLDL
jgi:hypothetical protein